MIQLGEVLPRKWSSVLLTTATLQLHGQSSLTFIAEGRISIQQQHALLLLVSTRRPPETILV